MDLVTPILQKYTEVHTTMPQIQSHHKKWNFINHGILKYQDYQKLARSAKVMYFQLILPYTLRATLALFFSFPFFPSNISFNILDFGWESW